MIKRKDLAPSLEHSKYSSPPVEVPEPVERFLNIFCQTIEENDKKEVEIHNDDDWRSDEEVGDLDSNSGDAQHQVLFHWQPRGVQEHSPSSDQPPLASLPPCPLKLTVSQTPPYQQLRKSLQSVTPVHALISTALDAHQRRFQSRFTSVRLHVSTGNHSRDQQKISLMRICCKKSLLKPDTMSMEVVCRWHTHNLR